MKKAFYTIREMKLKGASFSLYCEYPVSEQATFTYKNGKLIMVSDMGQTWENTRYYTLSDKPIGYDMEKNSHLPYFAIVTEDLPGSCKFKPAVYKRCQLTTDFPNNYLVFEDLKTRKRLKIAMNSHTYEPIN